MHTSMSMKNELLKVLPTFDLLSFFLTYLCRKRLELEFGRFEKKSIKNNLENEHGTWRKIIIIIIACVAFKNNRNAGVINK